MLILLLATTLASQPGAEPPPGRGIPETLARERAATIRALRYELSFVVPADLGEPLQEGAILRIDAGGAPPRGSVAHIHRFHHTIETVA